MEIVEPGAIFGPYKIEGLIASGGMGQVHAARHEVYGTVCAIKILHSELHEQDDWRKRFNEEGVIGTQLKHPNLLSARELVEHDGRVAIVMDLIKGGQTLEKVVSREFPKGLPLVNALQLFLHLTQGIDYLHGKGIVHGDLKPENVMIEGDYRRPDTWTVKITDFGTVGLIAHPVVIDGRTAVVATPRYASPEHLRGVDRIEVRSDVYCLGLMLHHLLCGVHASDARTVREAALFVMTPVPLVNLVDQPEVVREVVRRATEIRAIDRYRDCRELALAVRDALDSLGVQLDLEDVAADLATEVDEERAEAQRKLTAAAQQQPTGEPAPAGAVHEDDPTLIRDERPQQPQSSTPPPDEKLPPLADRHFPKGSASEVTLEPEGAPTMPGAQVDLIPEVDDDSETESTEGDSVICSDGALDEGERPVLTPPARAPIHTGSNRGPGMMAVLPALVVVAFLLGVLGILVIVLF